MKNSGNIKRTTHKDIHTMRQSVLKALGLLLKHKGRPVLSLLLIQALVLVQLATVHSVVAKPVALDCFNPSGDHIFQKCPLGGIGIEEALEEQAIADVLASYGLPTTDRERLLTHGRDLIRGALFARLIDLIEKTSPTPSEQQALAYFANRIKQKRIEATTTALNYYRQWSSDPCAFGAPSPLEYHPGAACSHNPFANVLTGGPLPPSFEEFQQLGIFKAYEELNTPEATKVAKQSATNLAREIGLSAAGIITPIAAFIGSILPQSAFVAILPDAGATFIITTSNIIAGTGYFDAAVTGADITVTAVSSNATFTVSGGTAVAGPVAVLILALTIAITRGLAVGAASELPGKLEAAKTEAENATMDLRQLIKNEAGMQEVYGSFITGTLPEFSTDSVPPPSGFDRQFIVLPAGSTAPTNSPTISYIDWDGHCHTARQNGGWFVDRDQNGVESVSLSINAQDRLGNNIIVTRLGTQFILTKPVLESTEIVDEFEYRDCSGVFTKARIKFEQLTVLGNSSVKVGCPLQADGTQSVVIGAAVSSGDLPSSLEVTVNDGASATVNGITVRDLGVNSDYQVTANVLVPANTPVSADFTVKVKNTINQTASAPFTIKKTAIAIPLPDRIQRTIDVGSPYHAILRDDILALSCSAYSSSISITDGTPPPGLSLQRQGLFGYAITGTPVAAGSYRFIVTETLSNGEIQSRVYFILVNAELLEMPNNMVSWWRGENNTSDVTGRHNGSLVGSVGYTYGAINAGFKFDGDNGYVALPSDTFDPTLDFTYELWFKTKTPGVILGRQRGVAPYNTPLQGTRAPIYVGNDGKLHTRMFGGDGESFISSPNRIDNNNLHHVAVSYNRAAQIEQVFLDGNLIGSLNNLTQGNDPSFIYQLGTGYVSDSQLNMFGWFNFNGLIDEPTLYNRALTTSEISAIYAAGTTGKLSINPIAIPPGTHNGTDGAISLLTKGGIPPLMFSKDNGMTFQETNTFQDLSPGTYSIVIKDGLNHSITRPITVSNPGLTLSLASTFSNPTCTFSQTGSITLAASGATGAVEYSVLNGANHQPSNIFEGLSAGTYTPWVRDENTGTVFVGEPIVLTDPLQLTLSPSTVPAAIVGQAYAVTFTSNGGTGARRMTATNLAPWMTATSTASGLTISGTPPQTGNYAIFVKAEDANDCLTGRNIIINVVAPCATPPAISSCSPGRTILANGNCQASVPDFRTDIVAIDSCTSGGTLSVTQNPAPGSMVGLGTTSITLTVTDANNNSANCTTSLTVTDGTPPTLNNCPANITRTTDANQCSSVVTYTVPTASDNCSGVGTPACTPPSNSIFPKGITTVNCSVSDSAKNQATCSFTVTVNDTQKPTITCPASVVKSTDANQCSALVTFTPTASDNCSSLGAPSCTPSSGSVFPKGITTVTCTVTDAAGNQSSPCSFTVTVNDTQPPTLASPANLNISASGGQCSAVVTYTVPTASDNCTGVGAVTCTPPSGSTFPVGASMVHCSVKDAANNQSTCSFTVRVVDAQAPTILCPANQTIVTAAVNDACQTATFTVNAVDNCSGTTIVCNPPSGSCFPAGVTRVTCTATDQTGNTATCSFTVTVFNARLQDDSAVCGNTVLFNTLTGDYQWCCGTTIFTGRGTMTKAGNTFKLEHNAGDRRVLINLSAGNSPPSGTANFQSLTSATKCMITDRDIRNDTCICGG